MTAQTAGPAQVIRRAAELMRERAEDGLDTAPRCMHGTWPCGRENCSRGRYAMAFLRMLELAGGNGQEDRSEDEGQQP
jgi:hypothetical protein